MPTGYSTFEDEVFEPLHAYKSIYKRKLEENAKEHFNELEQKSGIDPEANRQTNKKFYARKAERDNLDKKISRNKALRIILIVLTVVSFIVGIFSIVRATQNDQYLKSTGGLLALILGLLLGVLFLVILIFVIRPKLKRLRTGRDELSKEIDQLLKEAWAQMNPLNDLFEDGMSIRLFKKTVPLINFDLTFDSRRLDYLTSKFKFNISKDVNRSTLYVQSGEIKGNPFFIANDLIHNLGTKIYTGSLVIHWTETRMVNGRSVTVSKSQTLTANVTKPCPYYKEEPYLVYANEAAPDLIFSRVDSDAEIMSDKQIERHVSKEIKKLNKRAEKGMVKGDTFTTLGNSEFEVLFGAVDRNHEVQFRLLFTPLAQKQLLQIMKDKTVAFGDDFDFVKHQMINVIYPNHLRRFDFNDKASLFYGHDYEVVKERFLNYNIEYFKNVYFAFAPVLSIPLYQQQKPHEYIYKDLYNSYVSFYEHEKVVNAMNATELIHPLSGTRNILKTSTVKSGNFYDTVKVTAYGYQKIERVDYISKRGGDGRLHQVPVQWIEYIPVQQDSYVNINAVTEEKEETHADKIKKAIERIAKGDFASEDEVKRVGLFLAYVVKKVSDKK